MSGPGVLYLRYDRLTDGGFWARLEREANDGCAPHILSPWTRLQSDGDLRRMARDNGATAAGVRKLAF